MSVMVLGACSNGVGNSAGGGEGGHTPATQGITNGVVKVQAVIPVTMDRAGLIRPNARIDNPITIINPSNVKFEIAGNAVTIPTITNGMLDLGKLTIGELFDNDLSVCGANGKTRCTRGYIQMYTTGTPGAGIWNKDGGYGMPMYANQTGATRLVIGLGAANAAVVHEFSLSGVKGVLRLSDLPSPAVYEMKTDFTDAGAGTYSTNLVVEYGLLP